MAEFSPTTFAAPTTGGAGTVQSASTANFSSVLASAGKLAERVHGKVVAEKAFKNIDDEQNKFLENRNQIVEAQGELALLRDQNPKEAAIVDRTEKRIRELENFVTTGGISPTAAASRVEALRKEAMNKAPIFSQEIRGFAGARGVAFDSETEQLIKERNDTRDSMVEVGFNPDNPKHIEEHDRYLRLQFKNKLNAETDIRDERNAEDLLTGIALQSALPVENKIRNALESVNNDVSKLDPEVLNGLIFELNQAQSNLDSTTKRLAIEAGFSLSSLSDDVIKNVSSTFSSNLSYYASVLDGSLTNTATSNILKTAENNQLLEMQRTAKGMFNLFAMSNLAKPGSVAAEELSQKFSNRLVEYLDLMARPTFGPELMIAKFRSSTAPDVKIDMDNLATMLKSNRRAWLGIKNPDVETLTSHSIALTQIASTMAVSPSDISMDMVTELMDSVNSKNFMGHLSTLEDTDAQIMTGAVGEALEVYSHEKLIPDIKSDLDSLHISSRVGTDIRSVRRGGKTLQATDYITIGLNSLGGITFKLKSFSSDVSQTARSRAAIQVADLTKKYSNFSSKISATSAGISGAGTSLENRREQGQLLFGSLPLVLPVVKDKEE